MKEKVKVRNKWKFRLFIIQFLSVLTTIILLFSKVFGMNISWMGCLYPTLITIGIPLLLVLLGITCAFLLFGILYLFSTKNNKKKLREAFGKIKWKK